METREILQDIINDFEVEKFIRFFRGKSNKFAPKQENLTQYNDEHFKDGKKLGEISFAEAEQLAVFAFRASQPLSERTGKKAQYEKGKKILRERQYDAGIFIFYDAQGNFRFSLIYANYLGKHRDWSVFRRFTYFVSKEFTNKTFYQRIGEGDFSSLEKIKDAFSVEKVTKEFYESIANWYFWAVEHCQFPKDAEAEENGRNIAVIRLITRMIFIWFMRERGLVPKGLFEEKNITSILKSISAEESSYYTGILQNLFFATLSTKKEERQFGSEVRGYKGYNPDFGNQYVFRYQELFKNPDEIKKYFGNIPFLNGGLFECLDDKINGVIIDGFSRTKKNQPTIPNFLFFSQEKKANLNKAYGTKNKTYKVRGLLDILSSFNFTIDENSPDDADVALDPELLGRVFENLLASFNPETSTTARKATGSYYTPREIVDYMVAESLKAYFKTHFDSVEKIDEKLENLFSAGNQENPFDSQESKKLVELIESVKIVDPAVGSGAFPMGVLNKMVFILNKVDSGNELWKQVQLKAADAIPDSSVRREAKIRIEEFFKSKNADYGRKLYLIQRCIYGVDIQQIAVEIAKLRFFISLLVDEKIDQDKDNWGIEPLPNLDYKIMQGNSLLEEYEGIKLIDEQFFKKEESEKEIIERLCEKRDNFSRELFESRDKGKLIPLKKVQLESEIQKIERQIKNFWKEKRAEGTEKNSRLLLVSETAWKAEQLLKLQRQFFVAYQKSDKRELKEKIENLSWELIEATLKEQGKQDKIEEITRFRKTNIKPFFLWKLHFAEVFQEKGGFDVVIANPPYVRADDPSIKNQRNAIKTSKNFHTLWEKWDLYVAFIEKGYGLLAQNGVLEFIIPDAYMSSKYAEKSHKYFLHNATISRIDFCSDLKIFEAAVRNIIIEFMKHTNPDHIPVRIKHKDNWNNFIILPSKKQLEMGKNTFRLDSENKNIGDLSNTLNWGDICYVSYGVAQSSDEKKYKGEFTKEDVLSDIQDDIHPFGYIEGKYIESYAVRQIRYIEWGTTRSPRKWRRVTFPELYVPEKIMLGGMTGAIIDEKGLLCNHSMTISVLWKDLANVNNRSIEGSIKKDFHIKSVQTFRKQIEGNSGLFNLKYLLAILNSKFAHKFLDSVRRSQIGFYPDDLKKLPIKKISTKDQKPFIEIVDKILALTKFADYLTNPAKQAEVKEYERQIDRMVCNLYDLTTEEIGIIEGVKNNGEKLCTYRS